MNLQILETIMLVNAYIELIHTNLGGIYASNHELFLSVRKNRPYG